jgi:cleavage stimulation factor subunit 3
MAEEDPEIALLHQLQAGQESFAWGSDGTNGAPENEQPSITEDNNEQDKKETVADDQVQRALSPSGPGAVSDTTLLAVPIAGEEQSRSSSRASTRVPRVVGGFIADDSDEEDASTPHDGSTGLQVPSSNTPNRTISPSPLQSVTNSETTGAFPASALSVNSSVPPPVHPATQTSVPPPSINQAAVQNAVPKARLPHDRLGILEDRIRDDPRGDIEAWLSLITEYRSRHKLDEAREVYERFFKVFPQAVGNLRILIDHV